MYHKEETHRRRENTQRDRDIDKLKREKVNILLKI